MDEVKSKVDETKEDKIVKERTEKIKGFFKSNPNWIFYIILIGLLVLGIYIRIQPLTDHNGKPGLWDITTNDYTLGPDLDPFLFLRYAKTIIANGSLPQMDMMRNVPHGFDTSTELQMTSYMVVLTYRILSIFGSYSENYAGALMPVILFAFTIITFFLFVREIFTRKSERETNIRANIISLIATLFMIIVPGFLSRTVAGIPEKESVAFLFMFLSFFLFLKAWKSEKRIAYISLAALAGISTALMGLTWGGVTYVYITIAIASLAAFLLNKVDMKEAIIYSVWIISSILILTTLTNRFVIKDFVTGLDTGLASLAFLVIIAHLAIWKTPLNKILGLGKIKLPKTIISVIVTALLGFGLILIINPSFILDKWNTLNDILIRPVTGRWSTTVAENRQPYFTDWVGDFGLPFFWLFFCSSIVLFKDAFKKIKKRDSWILAIVFIFFLFGLIFSRYAQHPNILDGEGLISKVLYFGSALLLLSSIVYLYIKYHKENDDSFEKVDYEYLLLLSLFILTLFTARSAIRLIMVLVPIAPIFVAYLIGRITFDIKKDENIDLKAFLIIALIVVLLISIPVGYGYFNTIKGQAYSFVPNAYTLQWQKSMSWVRENTPAKAIFAHWWDYGYWVQSIGNRATVVDGGNAYAYWNYLVGRYVLTGDNQKDSLEFLHTHNATHLLIDSTDMSKYGAFSQIGSDINFDRLSYGPVTMVSDPKQTQETKNGTVRVYQAGGYPVDEDIYYEGNGTKTNLFQGNSYLVFVLVKSSQNNNSINFEQPEAIFVSSNKQIAIPMRYMYYDGKFYDYKIGINATIYIIPRLTSTESDTRGAALYLSPRLMRGYLAQVYILNDPFNNFPNFKLVNSQDSLFIESFESQGLKLNEFSYLNNYGGLNGPIKIWEIEYKGDEKTNPEYLLTRQPSYITWRF